MRRRLLARNELLLCLDLWVPAFLAHRGIHGSILEDFADASSPDTSSCASLIDQCARAGDLSEGKKIHRLVVRDGIDTDDFLAGKLLAMYCKCGSPAEAKPVFDSIERKNVVSWTSLISANARSGHYKEALFLYGQMQLQGIKPNLVTFATVLGACSRLCEVDRVRDRVEECCGALEVDVIVATAAMNAYARCGDLDAARRVFDAISIRDAAVWNAMISLLVARELGEEALEVFREMRLEGVLPNRGTCVAALSACCNCGDLVEGVQIHAWAIELGDDDDTVVQTSVLNMFGKFGTVADAEEIFARIRERDVAAWNAIITANAGNGFHDKAFRCFREMLLVGELPNKITYVAVLNSCFLADHLKNGEFARRLAVESGCGFESGDVVIGTAIVNMYVRCKCPNAALSSGLLLEHALKESSTMVWNTILSLYVEDEQLEAAFAVFRGMLLGGIALDAASFVTVLTSSSLSRGKFVHSLVANRELIQHIPVQNALINMYARCGALIDARDVFDAMATKNIVSWTAMLGVYNQLGFNRESLQIFKSILCEGLAPNEITFTATLNACGSIASIRATRIVRSCLSETGFLADVEVANSLLCALGKCGSFDEVTSFFEIMPVRNQVSWNTAIAANAQHGHGRRGLELFQTMQFEGYTPGSVTLIGVLASCSHAGLVAEGFSCFINIREDYGFSTESEHFSCVIDLLSRAGWLGHAEEFAKQLPFGGETIFPWIILLGGCKIHGDLDRGRRATQKILGSRPGSTGAYLVMHNLYAGAGRWSEAAAVKKTMVEQGPKKEPGLSWIEVKGRIHEFRVGDSSHPRSTEIQRELERLNEEMKRLGFVCDTKAVAYDLRAEEKETLLCQHSEKLAMAFGLISTAAGETLRVMKNLRVCSDCHSATKFISKVVGREIVVRDSHRFHHFRDGTCSCGDYW